ncbi:MAG: septum formation protein Maf [Actinobacteria bacterium]|nr:septum formation protein Maf [Actinomycetota bacterium]
MEEEEKNKQKNLRVILASASPRRKLLLQKLKLDFEVMEGLGVVEKKFKSPYKTATFNSNAKAQFAYSNIIMKNPVNPGTVIAGFDTVIFLKGRYFGKPANKQEAKSYLQALSGRSHLAITGVTLIDASNGRKASGYAVTKVVFEKLSSGLIERYLEKEDVYDKAGAYDISGYGSIFVKSVSGCFFNVTGFPVQKFFYLLAGLGYSREYI